MRGIDKPDVSVAVDAVIAIMAPVCLNQNVVLALDAVREMARLAEERAFEEGQNSVLRAKREEKARHAVTEHGLDEAKRARPRCGPGTPMRSTERQHCIEAAADLRAALDLIDVGNYDEATALVQEALAELAWIANRGDRRREDTMAKKANADGATKVLADGLRIGPLRKDQHAARNAAVLKAATTITTTKEDE